MEKAIVSVSAKGNKTVLPEARKAFKAEVVDNLKVGNLEFEMNDSGELYAVFANDEVSGETVYVKLAIVITANDPSVSKAKSKAKLDIVTEI